MVSIRRVSFLTLGCKVNQYETQAMKRQFEAAGILPVQDGEDAEIYVVNSCTVTAAADKKARQLIARIRREHPAAVVALTGCLPQAAGALSGALDGADVVTGSKNRAALLPAVLRFLETGRPVREIQPHLPNETFEPVPAGRFDGRFQKAYLKVEDGCDRFCSYCIIPAARGPVRSRPPEEIAREAETLVRAGYREIILVGINLSRYGADLGLRLPDAVRAAARPAGDFRLRLGSVEPALVTEADYRALAEIPRLCPHFHLSLQSGCDGTLRRMNRRYTTAEYQKTVGTIRSLFENPSVTTDLMAGFPGETDAEFSETCSFVEWLGLLRAHIFEYSPRPGTPAAAMPDQVASRTKAERAKALAGICRRSGEAFARSQAGKTVQVLIEQTGGGGYSGNYTFVRVPHAGADVGALRRVRVTGTEGETCLGELLPEPQRFPAGWPQL